MVNVIGNKPETRGESYEMQSGGWEWAVDRRGRQREGWKDEWPDLQDHVGPGMLMRWRN